jgi:hypothetical protein
MAEQCGPSARAWTRRALVATAAAAPLAACASKPPSAGPVPLSQSATTTLYPKVIDCSTDSRPYLAALKSAGIWTVFRYYAREKQDFLPQKRLTPEEAEALIAEGFSIGVVYQYFNNIRENINADRGRLDANYARGEAARLGQPAGSAIHFGIDGDWTDPAARADIGGYFRAVRRAFEGSGYRIGAYGSGATLAFLESDPERLVDLFWLAYPQGWSGAAAFYNSGKWTLFQSALETEIGGLALDANLVNPALGDFGQWGARDVDYDHPISVGARVIGARRFVATRTARLRVLPDQAALEISSTSFRKGAVVRVLETIGDWAAVDVNESGARAGYARLSDLTADMSRRPDFTAPDA